MPLSPLKNKPARLCSASLGWGLAGMVWIFLVGLGIWGLWQFEATPAAAFRPAAQMFGGSVALDPTRPTLILLAHPKCPCTRASLAEMNRLATLCPGRAALWVLFLRPPGCSEHWTQTGLWREAAEIPGVRIAEDKDGKEAHRLGATTSGETLLYAPNGRLLFHGGLTGGRGHEGDNAGLSAVVALLEGRMPPIRQSPVYGCPLTAGTASPLGGRRCLP